MAIFHGALEVWRKLLEPSKKKIDFLKSLSRLTILAIVAQGDERVASVAADIEEALREVGRGKDPASIYMKRVLIAYKKFLDASR